MHSYHDSHMGIQVTGTGTTLLSAFRHLLLVNNFVEHSPEEILEMVTDKPELLTDYYSDGVFIQNFLELLVSEGFEIRTAYHGYSDTPVWISHPGLEDEYALVNNDSDMDDFCISIERLNAEVNLVTRLRDIVRQGLKDESHWETISPYVGKVMISKTT